MASSPAALQRLAKDYYQWRDRNYPVRSSNEGLHTWDDKLTDYSPAAIQERRQYVRNLLPQVRRMKTDSWRRHDRINWLLFRAQLEEVEFYDRVLNFEGTNPKHYVDECSNAIFSLLKKDYDTPARRALSAAARLKQMPAMLEQGKQNLEKPVRLYARLAIESARSIDSLFNSSLMTLVEQPPAGRVDGPGAGMASQSQPRSPSLSPGERAELVRARDVALAALHSFADWLEKKIPEMAVFTPMGEENYNFLLSRVYLLPLDAKQVAMLGEAELARYRALESLLPDPTLADPNPSRVKKIPHDQDDFLKTYENRQTEMIGFLKDKALVTLPDYLGPFRIRQLPEAFKPTSPGGFMNPPGLYDQDSSGFYFIPTYNPQSRNFYIRAAIEDPRPILGHEGIPGHFLQLSIANHLADEIRRQHTDGVFIEGWALYTEEMLMRTGLYPENSAAQGQILRLSRYRAARIGVDVNLHTGKWSFEDAVNYFMEAGGLDREAAEGEAAGAASSPLQKITYMVGKWQIMRLLGKYRDRMGQEFQLGKFHDDLLKNGSLPLSIVEWILLGDATTLEKAVTAR
jgi:uncharacterized protein (DUF885 family)